MAEITVLLVGGPAHLPAEARVRQVGESVTTIKCTFGAGYEHFERTGRLTVLGDESVPLFQWVGRTAVAE
jgi:hypothetical protein